MAARYQSFEAQSGSSEDSELDDDIWGERESSEKLNLAHNDLFNEDFELRLANQIQLQNHATVSNIFAPNNFISLLPDTVAMFVHLSKLDLSHNRLTSIPDSLANMVNMTHMILTDNLLTENDFPKTMSMMTKLRTLNLSGNQLEIIPQQILEITSLRSLYLGANCLREVTPQIRRLRRLKILYLGGNQLHDLPDDIGGLEYLCSLSLSDNKLRRLPETLSTLSRLRVLHLHQNMLTTLPHGLIFITSLQDLSLRDNPLVMRFIRDMELQPASLLELSARVVKLHKLQYALDTLPGSLLRYLDTAHQCLNPDCDGVYFDHRIEHVKFSDFCGKYRVPLLQYLCSAECSVRQYQACSETRKDGEERRLPLSRVLLG